MLMMLISTIWDQRQKYLSFHLKECYIIFVHCSFSCTMINVHAPTNGKTDEDRKFYNVLEQNINQIANSGIQIILLMQKLAKKT